MDEREMQHTEDTEMRVQRRLRRREEPAEEAAREIPAAAEPAETPGESGTPETELLPDRAPETLTAAQSADSRVPPEARRMAAAPYGTVRPGARRPGTRPMVAPKRPDIPEEARPKRPAAPRPEAGMPPRVRVGYAPGRINEEMTRQMPAREAAREPARESVPETARDTAASREARAYLEKRKMPFRPEGKPEAVRVKPIHRTVRIAVVLLLLAGAVLAGLLILRGGGGGKGNPREPLRVMNFDARETQGLTAPADVTFSVMTDKEVQEIRLTDEDRQPVPVSVAEADNADGKDWIITLHVESGFDGTVRLEVRRSEEEAWQPTEYTSVVMVSGIPELMETATPEPDSTPAPGAESGPEAETESGGQPEGEAGMPAEEGAEPVSGRLWEEGADETEANGEQEETEIREDSGEEPDESMREIGELRTVEPTATPAPEEEKPTPTPPLTAEAAPEANPDLIAQTVIYTGNKKEKEYSRPAKELIHMPAADEYTTKNLGVMTFRGDNFRRNAAAGTLTDTPLQLSQLWSVEAGSARGVNQTYYGYGWPGQPAIARWSKQVRQSSNLYEAKQNKEKLKEVIIAGLDGNIRFLDLDDGSLTRNSIKLGYPMRGTPSLHTLGAPFISVGQFARKMKVKTGKIGLRQYNLYSQKELKLLDGLDGKQHRPLNDIGSFETSALVDRVSDTLITAGSNGMLYLEALNSVFDYNAGVLTISPSITVMTSRVRGQKNTSLAAVESSVAAYDKYVFYADMGGVLRCVDTNILTPVWAVNTGDSVMAAVALDLTEKRELNLYTANMLNNRKKGDGSIQIRRLDALSGREAWCTDVGVFYNKKEKIDVGAKASPVIGQHRLGGLVYFTVTGLSEDGRGRLGLKNEEAAALIALDKETGTIAWSAGLSSRSESSPVAVYDNDGNGWIIQCEQNGTIHLLEGLTGTEIHQLKVNGEIEASPAVYGDIMVIGTTGKGTSFIYGIEIQNALTTHKKESEAGNEKVSGST